MENPHLNDIEFLLYTEVLVVLRQFNLSNQMQHPNTNPLRTLVTNSITRKLIKFILTADFS